MKTALKAGAAAVDITPATAQFLYGYPHVSRYSTGVHDPLFSSALFLDDGRNPMLMVANDIIYIPKALGARARERIARRTGVPVESILVSGTHTHSGPIVMHNLANAADPVVPEPDPAYLKQFEDGIVAAAEAAAAAAVPAEIGLSVAQVKGVGTNRRAPNGPADPDAPVMLVRAVQSRRPLAAMIVYAMHPTVLHEDSTLVSADFPGMARQYLQREVLGADCPVLHHMGAAGNQSPRHCVRGQTFAEAERLGRLLGDAVALAIGRIDFRHEVTLRAARTQLDLPLRALPTVEAAERTVQAVRETFACQQGDGTPRAIVRTTECDLFGAESALELARAACDGRLQASLACCMPAEIQVLRIGDWTFAAWPGEIFVEHALAVRSRHPDTYVLTCANGTLQGYIVTPEAAGEGGYEASNAVFSPESGVVLAAETTKLIAALR